MFASRLSSLTLSAAVLVLSAAAPLARAQAPAAATGSTLPPCKGSVRATWNNCSATYTTTDGAVYVGEFRSGKYNGQGTATWPNGDRYVGNFVDDKFNGQGVYSSEKNFVYIGEFRDGKFNGVGTYTSSNGMRYVGEWRDDEKNGQGTYTWPSGRVYTGQFREDERDGQGTEVMPDGSKFIGEFRDGKRSGAGTLYDAGGKVLQAGVWRDDRYDANAPLPIVAPVASAPVASIEATPVASIEATPVAPSNTVDTVSSATRSVASAPVTTPVAQVSTPRPAAATPAPRTTTTTPRAAAAAPAPQGSTSTGSAGGRGRVALVIGNQNYLTVPPLRNARADAQAMAKSLKGLGFEVLLRLDLDDRALRQALRDFKAKLDGGSEAVFYYAGHGVQLGAGNYLLPTNIISESEEQVQDDSIMLQRVLDDLAEQKVRFSVAIVDACRENPFPKKGTRSIGNTRGLAPAAAASGQMILFSAGTGQSALDDLGPSDRNPNGVFTRVLLRELETPGVPVDQVLKRTRQEVVAMAKSIGHDQVPALYDQTIGEFYFKPAAAVPDPAPAAPVAMAAPAVMMAALPTDDRALWESVKESKNPEEIQAYLDQFPQGLFAGVAAARLRAMSAATAAPQPAAVAAAALPGAGGGRDSASLDTPPMIAQPMVAQPVMSSPMAATPVITQPPLIAANSVSPPALATPTIVSQAANIAAAASLSTSKGQLVDDLQKLGAGAVFKDCADCPDMVVVPPGRFQMGLAEYRDVDRPNEGPVRTVTIPGFFAVGRSEVTWDQYSRFARETSRKGGNGCATFSAKKFRVDPQANWNSPGFSQSENNPVVCVSWDDAKAYAEWLGVRTGQNYRLLTEAEWEYVARGGTASERFWGDNPADACRFANVRDATGRGTLGLDVPFDCRDRHATTAPTAIFQANPFGVYDVFGNVEEWVLDCWSDNYRNAPTTGVANNSGDCDRRVLRGGSWFDGATGIRVTGRSEDAPGARYSTRGFRIARTN